MSKIQWDKIGERLYEAGVDQGVLFPIDDTGKYSKGVPWNGLTAVNENPSGAEATALYADNIKYLNLLSTEDFGATAEAYTYPEEFEACDGSAEVAPGVTISQQTRKIFGMSYRNKVGNDVKGQNYGYKIHLVWGCQAAPSAKNRETLNESPDAIKFSWEIKTTPVAVPGYNPTAHMVIDSTKVAPEKMAALEDIIYGSESAEPRLPMPEEVIQLMKPAAESEG